VLRRVAQRHPCPRASQLVPQAADQV